MVPGRYYSSVANTFLIFNTPGIIILDYAVYVIAWGGSGANKITWFFFFTVPRFEVADIRNSIPKERYLSRTIFGPVYRDVVTKTRGFFPCLLLLNVVGDGPRYYSLYRKSRRRTINTDKPSVRSSANPFLSVRASIATQTAAFPPEIINGFG